MEYFDPRTNHQSSTNRLSFSITIDIIISSGMKITHFPYWMITSTTIPRTNSWRGYHPLHPLYSYYSYYCYLLLLLLLLLLTIILCSCWSYDITSTILTYINHITYYSTSTIFRFSRRPQGGPSLPHPSISLRRSAKFASPAPSKSLMASTRGATRAAQGRDLNREEGESQPIWCE